MGNDAGAANRCYAVVVAAGSSTVGRGRRSQSDSAEQIGAECAPGEERGKNLGEKRGARLLIPNVTVQDDKSANEEQNGKNQRTTEEMGKNQRRKTRDRFRILLHDDPFCYTSRLIYRSDTARRPVTAHGPDQTIMGL